MRTRFLMLVFVLAVTVTSNAAPRETEPREPRFFDRIIRVVKYLMQPLGDGIVPPHP